MMSASPRDALILAGGLGTRLRSVINEVPKPIAPVNGRPFLEYLLDYWIEQGIDRFVLSVGYLAEKIQEHFGTSYRAAAIEYLHETQPLGTGGAIASALQENNYRNRHLLVLNGDTWFNADFSQLIADAGAHDASAVTMTLKKVEHNDRYGGVELDANGLVKSFVAAQSDISLINVGCYLLDVAAVSGMLHSYPQHFSFERDYLVEAANLGKVSASVQDADFIDIGVPEDYWRAGQFLAR